MIALRMVVQLPLLLLSIFILMGTQARGNDVVPPHTYRIKFADKPPSELVVTTRSENGFHLLLATFRPEAEGQGAEAQGTGAGAANSINPEMRAVISASDTTRSDGDSPVYYPSLLEPLLADPHFVERTGQDDSGEFFSGLLETLHPITRNGGVMPSYAVLHGLESSASQDRETLLLPLPPINVSAHSESGSESESESESISIIQIIPEINQPIVTVTGDSGFSVTGEVEVLGLGTPYPPRERISATAIFSHNTEDDSVRLESLSIDNLARVERMSPAEGHSPSQDGLMERLWNPLTHLPQVEEEPPFAELRAELRAEMRKILEAQIFRATQLSEQERECLERIMPSETGLQKILETIMELAYFCILSPTEAIRNSAIKLDVMVNSVVTALQEENGSEREKFKKKCHKELKDKISALMGRASRGVLEAEAGVGVGAGAVVTAQNLLADSDQTPLQPSETIAESAKNENLPVKNEQLQAVASMLDEVEQLHNEERPGAEDRVLLRLTLQGLMRIQSAIREGSLEVIREGSLEAVRNSPETLTIRFANPVTVAIGTQNTTGSNQNFWNKMMVSIKKVVWSAPRTAVRALRRIILRGHIREPSVVTEEDPESRVGVTGSLQLRIQVFDELLGSMLISSFYSKLK